MISRDPADYVAVSCPTQRRALSRYGRVLSVACSKLRGAARFEDEIPANMRHTPVLKSELSFWQSAIDSHNERESDPDRRIYVRDWEPSDGDPSRLPPAPPPAPKLSETLHELIADREFAALRARAQLGDAIRHQGSIHAMIALTARRR